MAISRRMIISRSQSELDLPSGFYDAEDDVWFNQDKLFQDHVTEILQKWNQIDDEIWGKIICMERNRRIGKAYVRKAVLTISGADKQFDGYKIGLNGFENPMRDSLTRQVKTRIGKGIRLKMDEMGNIIIKRMSDCDVFVRGWDRENNSMSKDIIDLGGELEFEKSVKLFDMKKFQASVARELRSVYPDRKKLESQCICAIAFVRDSDDLLNFCSWVLLINVVALDLLKSRIPAILEDRESLPRIPFRSPKFVSVFNPPGGSENTPSSRDSRHRIIADEDPYSVPSLPTTAASRDIHPQYERKTRDSCIPDSTDPKPPELPPRDFAKIKKGKNRNLPRALKYLVKSNNSNNNANEKSAKMPVKDQRSQDIEYEDPYYCGLEARVPNFVLSRGPLGPHLLPSKIMEQEAGSGSSSNSDIRKCHSSGYLNSVFSQPSNLFNIRKDKKCNSNPYYDSSLESDVYGLSSGSGYEAYTPYGRLRAQLTARNGSNNGVFGAFGGVGSHNQKERRMNSHLLETHQNPNRYATEWD